jgi:hypothetical protein
VYREGFSAPLVRVALYKSYVQLNKEKKPNAMWAKYPEVMLAKCAESLALRSAFPNELSGVYTSEEMPEPAEVTAKPNKPVRGLDDVAAAGVAGPTYEPPVDRGGLHGSAADPDLIAQVVAARFARMDKEAAIDAETGEDLSAEPLPPMSSCPIFQSGTDKGMAYADVNAHKLQALLDNPKWMDKATTPQLEWARFKVAHRAWEKRNGINVSEETEANV